MAKISYTPEPHNHNEFLERALRKKGFSEEYGELKEEYDIIRELLRARSRSGLTQEDVAAAMGTTKSVVSRLESAGKHTPSVTSLKRYARAVGCHLEIRLVPDEPDTGNEAANG